MTWIFSQALMRDFESSRSSAAPGAASLAANSSAGEPSAPSNGSPTLKACLWPGKTTEVSPRSPYGMTCRRLTDTRGEAVLTWFLEASHVKTSAAPAKAPGSPVLAQDFGRTWRGLSTKYSHDMLLWKTPPSLWDEGLTLCLPTLPRWGSMLNGQLWERQTLVRLTNETAYGSLPTPVKYDSHGTWESNNYHGLGWRAKHEWGKVPMYPTPISSDAAVGKSRKTLELVAEGKAHNQLAREIRRGEMVASGELQPRIKVPTPVTSGLNGGSNSRRAFINRDPELAAVLKFPTPTARDADGRQSRKPPERVRVTVTGLPEADRESGSGRQLSLAQAANVATQRRATMWPTPVKGEDRAAAYTKETSWEHFNTGKHQVHLAQAVRDVRMWPTPVTIGLRGGSGAPKDLNDRIHGKTKLPSPTSQNGLRGGSGSEHHPGKWQHPGHSEYGELNPEWVEWIMGWPIGWTSLEPLPPEAMKWWLSATLAPEGGTNAAFWWSLDPSEHEQTGITKTVHLAADDKEGENRRVARIAALGNGQVPAVVAAVFTHLWHREPPPEKE